MQQTEPRVVLRRESYEKYCSDNGLLTQAQQAETFGMSEAYISRIRRDETEANAQFIAGVLRACSGARFEDFFELQATPAERRSA